MIEEILGRIASLPVFWIYISLFFFSYIENVFPPSPSDLVIVIGGSLVSTGAIQFLPTLILTTIGSVLGFMTLYFVGSQLDQKVIRAGKIKYVSLDALEKAERWFNKYGYFVILANRFLPGTRSVISFFAGLSELKVRRTVILAAISAFAWNAIIISLGVFFGDNIPVVDEYLSTYSTIGFIITAAVVLVVVIFYFVRKGKSKGDIS
jgi:membrane protein DedA with SNARE-associated domain